MDLGFTMGGVANIKEDTGIDRDIRGYAAFTVYGPKRFRLITVDGGILHYAGSPLYHEFWG